MSQFCENTRFYFARDRCIGDAADIIISLLQITSNRIKSSHTFQHNFVAFFLQTTKLCYHFQCNIFTYIFIQQNFIFAVSSNLNNMYRSLDFSMNQGRDSKPLSILSSEGTIIHCHKQSAGLIIKMIYIWC